MRCLFAIVCSLIVVSTARAETPPRPNILILFTDDQRADCLSCAGHPLLKTPHIDGLAKDGTLFRNAFVTTSICCISRASLITGRLCRHHQVGDFATPLPPAVLASSFPALLKQAGYRTGCFGKWGIGGPPPKEMFDVWDAWGGQGDFFHNVDGQKVHNSEWLARRAEEFVRSCKPGQPFCLIVHYKSPHDPYLPDPRDAALFKDDKIPVPKTASRAAYEKLPDFIRNSEGYLRAQKSHPTPESYQEFVKQYLRCIAGVDRSVGKILGVLDELQLKDDTAVVYSSDNGFFLGERGLSHKWLMHEESIRVPLIVRYPRLHAERRGQRLTPLVLNIDIAPTVLDLVGVKTPNKMDGRSLKPLLEGQRVEWRNDFFYEHHFHYGGKIPRTEGVRTADWKYITYFDVQPAYEELYDLAKDPHEEHNLAAEPAYRERLATMRALYKQHVGKLPPPVLPAKKP
ncbi:MAG: sulfatase [Planctomycetia bacterium]|nr:sulfatase [Planctomycetia bacterium]